MARSSEDLALAMDVIVGPTSLDVPGWALRLPPAQKIDLGDYRVAISAQQYRIRRVPNLT